MVTEFRVSPASEARYSGVFPPTMSTSSQQLHFFLQAVACGSARVYSFTSIRTSVKKKRFSHLSTRVMRRYPAFNACLHSIKIFRLCGFKEILCDVLLFLLNRESQGKRIQSIRRTGGRNAMLFENHAQLYAGTHHHKHKEDNGSHKLDPHTKVLNKRELVRVVTRIFKCLFEPIRESAFMRARERRVEV